MELGKIIAIIRDVDFEDVIPIAQVLVDEGITDIEVSLSNEEKGLKCIETLAEHFKGSKLHLGVGTVITKKQLELAVKAGATYIITPGWNRELVEKAQSEGITVYPGVFTPGEISEAVALGIEYFKLFPINGVNEAYIKALKGPFPNIKIMGVGGITVENIKYYQDLGIYYFGVGSDLVPRGATKDDLDKIRENAKSFVRTIEKDGNN